MFAIPFIRSAATATVLSKLFSSSGESIMLLIHGWYDGGCVNDRSSASLLSAITCPLLDESLLQSSPACAILCRFQPLNSTQFLDIVRPPAFDHIHLTYVPIIFALSHDRNQPKRRVKFSYFPTNHVCLHSRCTGLQIECFLPLLMTGIYL